MEDINEKRIVVVGQGGEMGAMIVRKLLEKGYDARLATDDDIVMLSAGDVSRFPADHEIVQLIRAHDIVPKVPLHHAMLAQVDTTPPNDWYQQFNGRRGRGRRY
jgi:NAD(P)-dependent dehydrogenase (short-subunit alcohol dehydrogenase family)